MESRRIGIRHCIVLCTLISLAAAQWFGNRSEDDEGAEVEQADGSFFSVLSNQSDKYKEAYSVQYQRLISNITDARMLIKLKDTEEFEKEDSSFFDPFFGKIQELRQTKFAKWEEIYKKGWDKMDKKLEKWNISGLLQEFYGVETGVSVVGLNGVPNLMQVWTMMVEDAEVDFAELDSDVALFSDCFPRPDWGYQYTRAGQAAASLGLQETDGSTAKVLVAVIDSGVDYDHPLLRDKIWINEAELNGIEGVDDDQNGFVDDIFGWNMARNNNEVMDEDGHGTHVSGIIVAGTELEANFTGAAPNVMILPCRFTELTGSGSVSAAIQCLEYSLMMGVDIISNSWGGSGVFSLALERAMDAANSAGVLQINAAGNDAMNNDGSAETATYPASFNHDIIISVAAIDNFGSLTSVSNYGNVSTDIAAPGESILSTNADGGLVRMSGTSQATPFVTAAASLLMGACRLQNKLCTAQDIKNALLQGAIQTGDLDGLLVSSGFLDIPNAARLLNLTTESTDREALNVCSSASKRPLKFSILSIFLVLLVFI